MWYKIQDGLIVGQSSSKPEKETLPNGMTVSISKDSDVSYLGWVQVNKPNVEWWEKVVGPTLVDGVVTFTVEDLPEEEVRNKLRNTINQQRTAQRDGGFGFTVGGVEYQWDTDLESRQNLIAAVAAINAGIPLPENFTWRTQDNQDVPMSANGVISLAAALFQHNNSVYVNSWDRKKSVSNAGTVAEIIVC